jgi:cytoskeletal protein RodZ
MTKSAFGEHLKREREMRRVSLEEISAATRIGTRFLEALEDEQWDRLPGGVFNRGFVRAVARFLGLDEESLLAEYSLATNDRPPSATWAAEAAKQESGARRRPWLLVVPAVVLVAGGWFAWHRYVSVRAARRAAASAKPVQTYQNFGAAPGLQGQAAGPSARPTSGPAVFELKIEAGKPTTVQVLADGKSVFNGQMAAGQKERFQAQEKFEVSTRNASALLVELNGQTQPPLGPPGRPAKVTLTRKDLKKTTGGPD